MKIDNFGAIITDGSYPGCVGDACANTARYAISQICGGKSANDVDLRIFRTEKGYVRHPTAPEPPLVEASWREEDFTSDQALPLLMAYRVSGNHFLEEMRTRVRWKTAPGKISSLGVMLVSREWLILFWLAVIFQIFIFCIPWRWSDDDRLKGKFWKFERSFASSSDYLNFAASLEYLACTNYRLLAWLALAMVGVDRVKLKILDYYKDESRGVNVVRSHFEALDEIDR